MLCQLTLASDIDRFIKKSVEGGPMKLRQVMSIVMLSVCCMQSITAVKQPVKASKKDPTTDKAKVTVKILGKEGIKKPIASASFTKDTSNLLSKLYFDFDKGNLVGGVKTNTVMVIYPSKKEEPLSIDVAKSDVKKGTEEIKISPNSITIEEPGAQNQVLKPDAITVLAEVKVPEGSRWKITSGTKDLTGSSALDPKKSPTVVGYTRPEVLDFNEYSSTQRKSIHLYQNENTKIYAQRLDKPQNNKMTVLSSNMIKKADYLPILQLDEDGKASVTSQVSLDVKQLNPKKSTTVPKNLQLKALLVSNSRTNYESILGSLIKNGSLDANATQELLDKEISEVLLNTPLMVALNAKNRGLPEEIGKFQNRYAHVYQFLKNNHAKIVRNDDDNMKELINKIISTLKTRLEYF